MKALCINIVMCTLKQACKFVKTIKKHHINFELPRILRLCIHKTDGLHRCAGYSESSICTGPRIPFMIYLSTIYLI